VPGDRAGHLPDNAGFDVGACLGIPVMTAHRCVHLQAGVKGGAVLVTGASGRVGYYAVQWAKLAGATVIGTAGSPERVEIARDSGADLVLDYNAVNVVEAVMDFTDGEGLDRIIDVEFGINVGDSAQMLKVNGVVASYSSSKMPEPVIPFYPLMFKNISLRTVLVYNMPETAKISAISDISEALENSKLNHRIAHRFTLEDTAKAHEAIEKGTLDGCVVVGCQEI
jgi:NADPH2:quinone reductase